MKFVPQSYGSAIADLLVSDRLPELGPGAPNTSARPKIEAIAASRTLGGQKIVDNSAVKCCVSALWLWHDFLDESHTLSQDIETTDGSYWHAIMHRRSRTTATPNTGSGEWASIRSSGRWRPRRVNAEANTLRMSALPSCRPQRTGTPLPLSIYVKQSLAVAQKLRYSPEK